MLECGALQQDSSCRIMEQWDTFPLIKHRPVLGWKVVRDLGRSGEMLKDTGSS